MKTGSKDGLVCLHEEESDIFLKYRKQEYARCLADYGFKREDPEAPPRIDGEKLSKATVSDEDSARCETCSLPTVVCSCNRHSLAFQRLLRDGPLRPGIKPHAGTRLL